MATDRQIFELQVADLPLLNSGLQVSTVVQIENYDIDFQVPLQLLKQYFQSASSTAVLSGTTNPDNAQGNNGDFYLKSDASLYFKADGTWQLLYTPATFIGGNQAPSSGIGKPGDFYVDTTKGYFYQKGTSSWSLKAYGIQVTKVVDIPANTVMTADNIGTFRFQYTYNDSATFGDEPTLEVRLVVGTDREIYPIRTVRRKSGTSLNAIDIYFIGEAGNTVGVHAELLIKL
jgi:hypothetical protein